MKRPLLPSHYSVWFAPPDQDGDESLHIVSERRSLTLKGYAFREFCERVVPLLDGTRSVDAIEAATADVFDPGDVADMLTLLAGQGVVVEATDDATDDEPSVAATPCCRNATCSPSLLRVSRCSSGCASRRSACSDWAAPG